MADIKELKIEGDLNYTREVQKILQKNVTTYQLGLELSNHVDGCVVYGEIKFAEGKEVN